jgi:AcrR family transcriptional regulator
VSRTVSLERPEELLDRVADYMAAHGVAELALRPLSKAVQASPRVLLYYFGSKEDMVVKALGRLRERQRVTYGRMRSLPSETPGEACRAIWQHLSAPDSVRQFGVSLEIFAMALRQPKGFADYLRASVEDWLEFLAAPLVQKGYSKPEARAHATVVLAGFRGFLLDYCAAQDRERIDRAVELWLQTLDAIPLRKEHAHGE